MFNHEQNLMHVLLSSHTKLDSNSSFVNLSESLARFYLNMLSKFYCVTLSFMIENGL